MDKTFLQYDVIIVGGGAAGLVAAVCCAKKLFGNIRVAVVEKEFKLGKKLLATGNGKCNMTNHAMSAEYYNLSSRDFISKILSKYSTDKIEAFWKSIGLITKRDAQGRVYPYSGQASSVLETLLLNLNTFGVDVFCETEITEIRRFNKQYRLFSKKRNFAAEKVVLASGGMVQPNLGSGGASYKFAEDLNLKCTKLFPSLAPVICSDSDLKIAKGVRTAADVSLKADGKTVKTEIGELQINEKNVSGICVFQLSRMVNEYFSLGTVCGRKCAKIVISADFMPEFSFEEIQRLLEEKRRRFPNSLSSDLFTGIINGKLGSYLLKKLGIDSCRELCKLTDDNIYSLTSRLKSTEFIPSAPSGINTAQVTAGGIEISEIDKNMESIKNKNLYIVGEALDVDGVCGGYNLHWAFASGITAGNHAANLYMKRGGKNDKSK